MEYSALTIYEASQLIEKGQISPVELVKYFLERIDRIDREINAFVTVTAEYALKKAAYMQEQIRKGDRNILSGIPMAIKDNICTSWPPLRLPPTLPDMTALNTVCAKKASVCRICTCKQGDRVLALRLKGA